jgi:hypothetical protein
MKCHRHAELRFPAWAVPLVVAMVVLSSGYAQDSPQNTAQKVRVYVTDSQSWEIRGGWGLGGNRNSNGSGSVSGSGFESGGARPQTAEIIKTFNQRCPEITITNNVERADFAVTLDHEGGKGLLAHRNKIVVFNREGDAIFSDSTRELGSSVADACRAILVSASKPNHTLSGPSQTQPTVTSRRAIQSVSNAPGTQPASMAEIEIASTPAGAEIQLDGSFIGSTPSTIDVAAGDHTIAINKHGFKLWERKIKVNGGKISVAAELETAKEPDASKQATDISVPVAPSPPSPPAGNTSTSPAEVFVTASLTSDPIGADIYIDDAETGLTPMTVKLKPGKHAIRMFMTGYQNWGEWLTIQAGADVHIVATLTKSN